MAMLKKITFTDFKSFVQGKLTLEEISVLIGSNASGKTNMIEGSRILSEIVTGRDISSILDGSKNVDSGIRGGSRGCVRFEAQDFTLGCEISLKYEVYYYEISIQVYPHIYVKSEGMYRGIDKQGILIFETKDSDKNSADIWVTYNNAKRGKNPDMKCIRTMAILPQMLGKWPEADVLSGSKEAMEQLVYDLKNILFLDPIPSQMRDYARIGDVDIRPNGENISAVLCNICDGTDANNERKEELLASIRHLPENEIEDIKFIRTDLNDVILALKEQFGEAWLNAKMLSDGTLRCMAILTAMISEPTGSLIVIEEVDNGIHPSRVKGLLKAIKRLADERGLRVLITTHNPALLDSIDGDVLGGVSLCYRNKEDGGSSFIKLVDIPEYFRLAAQDSLGDLVTNEDILRVLKEDRKENNFDWMGI